LHFCRKQRRPAAASFPGPAQNILIEKGPVRHSKQKFVTLVDTRDAALKVVQRVEVDVRQPFLEKAMIGESCTPVFR